MLNAGNYYEIPVILCRIIKMLIVPQSIEHDSGVHDMHKL